MKNSKTFGNFQVKKWHSFLIAKHLLTVFFLFAGKTWNFTKKDSIKDLTLPVKYIKARPDIIIKLFFANFENVFVFEINSESLFWKITLKERNKRNPSRIAFLWILPNFFRTLLVRVTSGWLLLRPLSRITHQNFVRFQGKHLRESSVTVKRLALRFAPVLLINLKLMISWY